MHQAYDAEAEAAQGGCAMIGTRWVRGTACTAMTALVCWTLSACGKPPAAPAGIAPETVADYVHAVIEADRIFYTVHVVERLQKKGKIVASENWRAKDTPPPPRLFFMGSSDLASKT